MEGWRDEQVRLANWAANNAGLDCTIGSISDLLENFLVTLNKVLSLSQNRHKLVLLTGIVVISMLLPNN